MPLSEQQSEELNTRMRDRLRTLEEEISSKLGDSAGEVPTFDRIGDDGDLAQVVQNSEMDLSEATRDIDEWRDLRRAIGRLEQGSYGVCIDCGIEIPFERLQVQPSALRCIDCQEVAERSVNPQQNPTM
jgi:DnaK suppressor protein